MKKIRPFVFTLFLLSSTAWFAQSQPVQDSTGLPGDNFSLQGALELFRKSQSIEAFEKLLNTENNNVNNLDLDGDGQIDYIKVIDKSSSDAHAFILQVPVSETENQDIAVIELEKTGRESAQLQIVGDEDIFGEELIVEPNDEGATSSMMMPVSAMPYQNSAALPARENDIRVIVNVWAWPVVRFVYAPSYVAWVSPWHWNRRPMWWRPWRPVSWVVWGPRRAVFAPRYVVVHHHRTVRARQVYRPARMSSTIVHTRYSASVGRYRATRTTTTIQGKNGRKVKVTKTKVRRRR